MKGGDKFVSRQIDGKGIGVIAITSIKQGELVISEEPLLIIPWYIRQAVAGYPRNCLEETLCDLVDDLPEQKRSLYMSLSDCKSEEDEKTEFGIWRTNNFALGPSHTKVSNGIFPTIARFNHSCIPNAEFFWNDKRQEQEVRAITSIDVGEEITLCYFISKWQLEPAEVRKQYLYEHYGFQCDCKGCSLTGPQLVEDEYKRARIIEIKQQFIELVYEYSDIEDDVDDDTGNKAEPLTESQINCDLHQALNLGLERLKLMDEMHLKCRSRLDFCCDLLEVAEDCGEYGTDKYALVAERGYILSLIVFGSRDTNTLKWKSKLKQDKLQQ